MKRGTGLMRVLFWSGTFWPHIGGVEVLAAKLLPALQERGYEFVVVTSQSHLDLPTEASYKGIPVYRFPFPLVHNNMDKLTEIRQQLVQLKRTFAPDLIHINAVGLSDFFHLTTANAHPAPLLVTLHGHWQSQLDSIVGHTLSSAAWVVGSSAAVLLRGQHLVPKISPCSSVIHNAIEALAMLPEPLPFHPPRVLCLGRLVPVKGVDVAIAAVASVVKHFPEVRLVIAGEGPVRTELERQTVELDLTQSVDFIGWVAPEMVPTLINTTTMVVIPSWASMERYRQTFGVTSAPAIILPSWAEGLPVVALEAALMARPVVATRVGGLPEVIVHEQTGLLIDSEDPTELAEAIMTLLKHPETATRMGQAARSHVQEVFSFERYIAAYEELYQKLIHRQRN